jgi:hypothetical protein
MGRNKDLLVEKRNFEIVQEMRKLIKDNRLSGIKRPSLNAVKEIARRRGLSFWTVRNVWYVYKLEVEND